MLGDFLRIDEREYHADRGRFSCSLLDKVARDPREARDYLLGRAEPPPSDVMRLGKYAHYLALEGPEVARDRIALPPSQHYAYRALGPKHKEQYDAYVGMSSHDRAIVDNWRRVGPADQKRLLKLPDVKALIDKAGRKRLTRQQQDPTPTGEFRTMERKGAENIELWDDFVESARGRTIVKLEQVPIATAMVRAIQNHPQASKLLSSGGPEQSMHWTCPHTGEPMKGRLDWLTEDDEPVELKFTHLVAPDNINQWLVSGWARKSAVYLDAYKEMRGKPCEKMWWIFVEMTDDDPIVHTCWVDEDHIFVRAGRDGVPGRYRGYIDLIRWAQQCRQTDDWRHPWQHVQDGSMIVPDWLATVVENSDKDASTIRYAGRQVSYGAT